VLRRLALILLLGSSCAGARLQTTSPVPGAAVAPGARPCATYGDEGTIERTPLEERAWAELGRARRAGRLAPSSALDRAARALAAAASLGAPDPLSRLRVQEALRVAGAFDPAPVAHLSAGSVDAALAALIARGAAGDASHAGVGVAEQGGVHHLVLLLSRRRVRLDRFPGALPPRAEATLSGALEGLLHPRAWVTHPDGRSEEVDLVGGQRFTASVHFAAPGVHAVELTCTGPRGPEVVALMAVSVGGAACSVPAPRAASPEPEDPRAAEQAVLAAAHRARAAAGLPPLAHSPEVSSAARRHAEGMRAAGLVAHVLPGGKELADRLRDAGIPFRRAWENLASGPSALEAHAATEASPAHRANLEVPAATSIGVGIARGTLATGEPVTWLAEILIEPPADPASDRMTPDARVREALWRERERRGLPPLTSDPALDAIARRAASELRAGDGGEVKGAPAEALRLRRRLAASDAFIAADPTEAVRSRNLPDGRFQRVGVGVVTGDSRRFGPARLFIAVVYTD
jgi:uncharacterized protein YkwD